MGAAIVSILSRSLRVMHVWSGCVPGVGGVASSCRSQIQAAATTATVAQYGGSNEVVGWVQK
jgi:hypothetical protein